jgi:hypothetical protein
MIKDYLFMKYNNMKIHDRFLFVWVVLVQIIFRNSRKIGSQICLIELVNI